jgi:hypothetical protein
VNGPRWRIWVLLLVAIPGLAPAVRSQGYEHFNLFLDLHFSSADRTLELYTGLGGDPGSIARLPGSRIALATTALLANRPLTLAFLDSSLESVKFNQSLGDDVFQMRDARKNVAAIKELLDALRIRNFGQKVVGTVEQLFPPDARVSVRVPVYFVAFGHENIDAFVRRVVWHGDEPQFVGEGEGTLTIVVNLAKAVHYGATVDDRFVGLMSVVAHEVFHAAFGAYKDASPVWQAYYARPRTRLDNLLDLTQNEGIAYYLSLIQQTRGRLVRDWADRTRQAFEEFNKRAEELLDPSTSPRRATQIIQMANTSGYWQSYGSIAGMVIARQIDLILGSQALSETIARGPADFFLKYEQAQRMGSEAPRLSPRILDYLKNASR